MIPEEQLPSPTTWVWGKGAANDYVPLDMETTSRTITNRPTRGIIPTHIPLVGLLGKAPADGWVCVDIFSLGGSVNYLMAAMDNGRLFFRIDSTYTPPAGDWSGGWATPEPAPDNTDLTLTSTLDATAFANNMQTVDLGLVLCPIEMRDSIVIYNDTYVLDSPWDVIMQCDLENTGTRLSVYFTQLDGYACFITTIGSSLDFYGVYTWSGYGVSPAPPPWLIDGIPAALRPYPCELNHLATDTAFRQMDGNPPASMLTDDALTPAAARQRIYDRWGLTPDNSLSDSIIIRDGSYDILVLLLTQGDASYNVSEVFSYSIRYRRLSFFL